MTAAKSDAKIGIEVMEMHDRIRELRNSLKLSQVEFGKQLGVSGAAISRIEKGERGLTEQMIKSICREFHVRREWLLGGQGEKNAWGKNELPERLDRTLQDRGEPARRIFRAFTEMNSEEWRALAHFLDRLTKA